MSGNLTFIIRPNQEGLLEARAVGHSIFTYGKSIEELRANLLEAILCHFDKDELPESVDLLDASKADHLLIPA